MKLRPLILPSEACEQPGEGRILWERTGLRGISRRPNIKTQIPWIYWKVARLGTTGLRKEYHINVIFLHGEFTITWDMGPQACVQTNQMDSTTYFWHCNFANLFTNQRTKNWLVVWNMFYFPSYMGIILPIDELIFFRRVGQPPADQKVFLLIRFDRPWDLPWSSKHVQTPVGYFGPGDRRIMSCFSHFCCGVVPHFMKPPSSCFFVCVFIKQRCLFKKLSRW